MTTMNDALNDACHRKKGYVRVRHDVRVPVEWSRCGRLNVYWRPREL